MVLPTTPFVKVISGVLVRLATCSRLTNTLPKLTLIKQGYYTYAVKGIEGLVFHSKSYRQTRATIEVYHFLAILFSERRGSLTQNRRNNEKLLYYYY